MYLGDWTPKRRRRSSPVRVAILLVLIGFVLYLYALMRKDEIAPQFSPLPTPTRSALAYAEEGSERYRQGRLDEAIALYQHAIQLDASDSRFYIVLSRLLRWDGQLAQAAHYGERAVEMAPQNAQAWAMLGMVYDWQGNFAAALEACTRAVELDARNAEAHACLAEVYADTQRWTEATEAIQRALELDDQNVDVHRVHGYVLETQGNWSGAIAEYQRALEIHPNLLPLYLAIGRNHRALGNFEAALESFQRAVEIAPDSAIANDELGWTYFGLGEYRQAEEYLKQAVQSDPTLGRAFGHLAITYWARRNYEAAVPNFEQALKLELAAARRRATGFRITLETPAEALTFPSGETVLAGPFSPGSRGDAVLQATLSPQTTDGAFARAGGTVTFDTVTGVYTVELRGLPLLTDGRAYVGWFDNLRTLSGDPVGSGPLQVRLDGNATIELQTPLVAAAPIEYYYTLGLAYYYLDQCDKAYPLFDAAMQIDPTDPNAPEGIRLCREWEQ